MRTLRSVRADERGVVVPSRLMVAAIVVVAIAAVMYVATSPGQDSEPARATSSSSSTSPSPSSTPTSSPSAKKSATPSSTPTTAAPSPTKKAKPEVKRADTFVAVFNNSGRVGLAARTASKVTGTGWKVVGTDNWYGSVPATTVYYPQKLKGAADVLAKDLGVRRVKPAVAPMRNDRLTLILTKDYTG